MKKLPLVIILITAASLGAIAVAHAGDVSVELQIPLPGIDRSLPVCTSSGSEFECTGIAQYIAYLYRWLVGIAAVLAALALSYGGVRWLLSGGESGKIQEAQKVIGSALMGLLIALLSYVALWTINPAFVQFGPLKIALLKKIELDIKAHIESHTALGGELGKAAGVPVSGFTNVKFNNAGRCNAEKDVTTSGVLTQLLVDLLLDIDKAGFGVTVTCMVTGHRAVNTFHNPDGRAADIGGDRATLVRLADYLGTNTARLKVNELFYAYNTDQTYNDCKEQSSSWLQNTEYKRSDGSITNLYEAHKDHLHVAIGCGSSSLPKK